MTRKANWAAVSGVAAAASALVALMAYATPHRSYPLPAPESSLETPPYATHTGIPAATSPGLAYPSLTHAQPAGPPAGCPEGKAAITRYDQTVGSTQYSQAEAAQRAEQDITMALGPSGANGTIFLDLQALSTDFANLSAAAHAGEISRYNTVYAQTQTNIQAFNADCDAIG